MLASRFIHVHALWGVRGSILVLLLAALLTSGCSAVSELAGVLFIRSLTAPAPTVLSLEEASHNRLLVIGSDGNLFSIGPDGRNRLDLTNDAGSNRIYTQPTWSPDGTHIAYTQIDSRAHSPRGPSLLVTVRADGNGRRVAVVPFPPFYIFWNPVGDRLAYLSNWMVGQQPTIALNVVEFTDARSTLKVISVGQPLYFSWSPDGEQLLIHRGNREVSLTTLDDGARQVLVTRSANFAAPQWVGDGRRLLYAIDEAGRQQIVVTDLQGTIQQKIAVNGLASFEINATGDQLAFVDTPQPVGTNVFGPLYLLEIDEQLYRQISKGPVIFFAWNPDGSSLLYMVAELQRGQLWLRPHIWDGEQSIALGRFRPSRTFFDQYVRFADQYAQSQRYWSSDSRHIVFSGAGEDGRSGVWIQTADGASDPVLVAEGVYATWSPQ